MSVTSVPDFCGAALTCGSPAVTDGTMTRLNNRSSVTYLSDARTRFVKTMSREIDCNAIGGLGGEKLPAGVGGFFTILLIVRGAFRPRLEEALIGHALGFNCK